MHSWKMRLNGLCGTLVLAFGLSLATGNAANTDSLSGTSLVEHLRHGGYVLLMRHAHSPLEPPNKAMADASNTGVERQLDETGVTSARTMGEALRKLHIPIGAVLSSPTYRALETLRIAGLGNAKTFPQLGDGGQSMMASAVRGQESWLRDKVAERPLAGSNTIIVTHMPNIQTAFGQIAKGLTDGEALIFRPDEHGGAALVARVPIESWPKLLNR
jgi:phosphohistidine phosphatase SixA